MILALEVSSRGWIVSASVSSFGEFPTEVETPGTIIVGVESGGRPGAAGMVSTSIGRTGLGVSGAEKDVFGISSFTTRGSCCC